MIIYLKSDAKKKRLGTAAARARELRGQDQSILPHLCVTLVGDRLKQR